MFKRLSKNNIIRAENFRMGYPSRAAEVHLNFRAGSTFPVLVCTEPPGKGQQRWSSTVYRTSWGNEVDAVRLYNFIG